MENVMSPLELRHKIRNGGHGDHTSGLCEGFVQCNMVILPSDWAADFHQFCRLNPKPCPLIAVSEPGDYRLPALGEDIDIRRDIPAYRVFEHGVMREEINDISHLWQHDLVVFLIGCSFSFEEALIADGLEVRNVTEGVNVPMYKTHIDCESAGLFAGKMVVSMRPYKETDMPQVRQICSRFPSVHGEPIHYGDPKEIGVRSITQPDYGDPVTIKPDEAPAFWACGVTPQVALENAKPPFCITHSPGCMLVTDLFNRDLAST